MLRYALITICAHIALLPAPAAADSYKNALDVRCAPDAQMVFIREAGTWDYEGPFDDGVVPADRDARELMDPQSTAPEDGDLMARCLIDRGDIQLVFEVRRYGYYPASTGLCGGAWADFAILLNGRVLALWPSGHRRCHNAEFAGPIGRSASFDGARVQLCEAVSVEGSHLGRQIMTVTCRAEDLETVLAAGAWPPA